MLMDTLEVEAYHHTSDMHTCRQTKLQPHRHCAPEHFFLLSFSREQMARIQSSFSFAKHKLGFIKPS